MASTLGTMLVLIWRELKSQGSSYRLQKVGEGEREGEGEMMMEAGLVATVETTVVSTLGRLYLTVQWMWRCERGSRGRRMVAMPKMQRGGARSNNGSHLAILGC